jgi:hypothetical protein
MVTLSHAKFGDFRTPFSSLPTVSLVDAASDAVGKASTVNSARAPSLNHLRRNLFVDAASDETEG